jgi:hypothetical protein
MHHSDISLSSQTQGSPDFSIYRDVSLQWFFLMKVFPRLGLLWRPAGELYQAIANRAMLGSQIVPLLDRYFVLPFFYNFHSIGQNNEQLPIDNT